MYLVETHFLSNGADNPRDVAAPSPQRVGGMRHDAISGQRTNSRDVVKQQATSMVKELGNVIA